MSARNRVSKWIGKYLGATDVWSVFTPLAVQYKSVNLGQGFPDEPETACRAIREDWNQYAPSRGLPQLREALSRVYQSALPHACPVDNILISPGANAAICMAIQAFIGAGEGVLLIEPAFDIYRPAVEMVGGRAIGAPMSKDWTLNFELIEQRLQRDSIKLILINTPHNPTGRVFSLEELKQLAQLAIKYDTLVLSDEVYDQLYYTPSAPYRLASLIPERCLTVGSGGKSFGVTGWRVGWTLGPKELIEAVGAVQARTLFTAPTPPQAAISQLLSRAEELFGMMRGEYSQRRDFLINALEGAGFRDIHRAKGGYFVMARAPQVGEMNDYELAQWMTTEWGITPIPGSAFYGEDAEEVSRERWLRFCFAKKWETLQMAKKRLEKLQWIKK